VMMVDDGRVETGRNDQNTSKAGILIISEY
jgi:hypothetical protein